jgi:hypothetical protein
MPSDDALPNPRRHRRVHARRRSRRRVWLVLVVVALVGIGTTAAFATGLVELDDSSKPVAARTPAPTVTTIAPPSMLACRPLATEDPLRLWIGGDSLAGSLGPSLGEIAAKTGVVQPVYYSKVSSGLTSSGFFDWPETAGKEMVKLHPEITVFIIDANDTSIVDSSDDWDTEYATLVEEMMQVLIGPGRTVYWIGGPPFGDSRTDEVEALNDVARAVASQHPEVTYVDTFALFSDDDGDFAASLPSDVTGETVQVRAGDGVHFTPEGGDRLARAVFALVNAQCEVSAQADPSSPKRVIVTAGSSSIPGTSREPSVAPTTVPTPTSTSEPATTTTTATSTTVPSTSIPSTTVPSITLPSGQIAGGSTGAQLQGDAKRDRR